MSEGTPGGNASTPADDDKVVRGIRFVPAEPQAIFDLLADPSQHPVIDGSGSVRSATEAPERLALGSKFSMSMKLGVPYKITNEVVEFEEPSLIAWQHMGKHVWRYRLRPVDGDRGRGRREDEGGEGEAARASLHGRILCPPRAGAVRR